MRGGRRVVMAFVLLWLAAAGTLFSGSGPAAAGTVTEDPYRFLDPLPGQLGDPADVSTDVGLDRGQLAAIDEGTAEVPPQAQLTAPRGTFSVPAGVTTVSLTIRAVEPLAPAPGGSRFVGNVYRFSLVTPDIANVPTADGKKVSIALRGLPAEPEATLYQATGYGLEGAAYHAGNGAPSAPPSCGPWATSH